MTIGFMLVGTVLAILIVTGTMKLPGAAVKAAGGVVALLVLLASFALSSFRLVGENQIGVVIRNIGGGSLAPGEIIATKGESAGIPWYAFLDAEGEIVVDSTLPEKGNIGYPYTNEEIATFMKVVQKAARTLNDDDIEQLAKSLRNRGKEAKKAK